MSAVLPVRWNPSDMHSAVSASNISSFSIAFGFTINLRCLKLDQQLPPRVSRGERCLTDGRCSFYTGNCMISSLIAWPYKSRPVCISTVFARYLHPRVAPSDPYTHPPGILVRSGNRAQRKSRNWWWQIHVVSLSLSQFCKRVLYVNTPFTFFSLLL